jgi:hypothetical protein
VNADTNTDKRVRKYKKKKNTLRRVEISGVKLYVMEKSHGGKMNRFYFFV